MDTHCEGNRFHKISPSKTNIQTQNKHPREEGYRKQNLNPEALRYTTLNVHQNVMRKGNSTSDAESLTASLNHEVRTRSHTIYKINSKWLNDLKK